jgi:hypothetical protein
MDSFIIELSKLGATYNKNKKTLNLSGLNPLKFSHKWERIADLEAKGWIVLYPNDFSYYKKGK